MRLFCIQLIILLLPLHTLYADEGTPPPVTVFFSYSDAYINHTNRTKTVTVPWENGLEMRRVIAAAGGFSNPPHREVYLIRNGISTRIQLQTHKEITPFLLQPGDSIEVKY